MNDAETRNSIHFGEALRKLLDYQRRNDSVPVGDALDSRIRLAIWHGDMGQRSAVDELQEIVHECVRVLDANDPVALRARFHHARWLHISGHSKDADRIMTVLLDDACNQIGERHPLTIDVAKELKSWRTKPRQQPKPINSSPSRPSRHETHHDGQEAASEAEAELVARLQADNVVPDPIEGYDLDELFEKEVRLLVRSSHAAAPLLEALALSFEHGVPRLDGVWATMANALSAMVLVEEADIVDLIEAAGPYIRADVDDGMIVYRLAHRGLVEAVLAKASRRTGLADELDSELRQRCISTALIREFVPNRYVRRNLPRHAAAGGHLDDLARAPLVLDQVDLDVLVEELLRASFGATPLPNELSGVLQAQHQLIGRSSDDRTVLRTLVSAHGRVRPKKLANLTPPVWTPAWTYAARDPRHLTIKGAPTRSSQRRQRHEVLALASATLPNDVRIVIIGYEAGTVELWNALTGRKIDADIVAAGDLVNIDTVMIDDHVLLAVLGTGGVRMWDMARRAPYTETWSEHDEIQAGTVARLPDGQRVLVLVDAQGHLVVLDPRTVEVLSRSIAKLDCPVRGITVFPSRRVTGDSVATLGDDGVIHFWEISPLRLTDTTIHLESSSATSIAAVQISGTTRLWVGAHNGKISLWDPYTGENVIQAAPDPHSGAVLAVAAITDRTETLVATGGAAGTIILRESTSGAKARVPLTGHTAQVRALAAVQLDDTRTVLVSAGRDSSVRMWDLSDARALGLKGRAGRGFGTAMAMARVGPNAETRLIIGYQNGSLRQHDIGSGEPVGTPIRAYQSKVRMMTELSTQGASSLVATVGEKIVRIWDPTSTSPLAEHPLPGGKEICTIVSTQAGRDTLLAMGFASGEIIVWNPTTDQSRPIEAHSGRVNAIVSATVHDHTYLVSAGEDRKIRFWNPGSGEHEEPDIINKVNSAHAMCLLPSTYGPTLVMSGDESDGKLRRYELANRQDLPTFSVDKNSRMSALYCLVDADERPVLVGIGRRSSIMVWRSGSSQVVHRLDLDGTIEASHAFDSFLVLSTQRGLYALNLTFRG
jgi:WD40 repeat protein